jgi:c-di-GMP-binding flagellar brake protein YcgR
MKRERRRNSRVPAQIPLEMASPGAGARFNVKTSDIGEGGMAITLPKRSKPQGRWSLSFCLPGSTKRLEISAEFAWEGSGTQVGLRFLDLAPAVSHELREWLSRNSPDVEKDDPPVRCQLTDLSLCGCYLEIPSPFPVSTRVTLSMRAAGVELRSEGVVRVMHPERGMGVEFTQSTPEHRALLEKFLSSLAENPGSAPELTVEPEGFENEVRQSSGNSAATDTDDPLLHLFRNHPDLAADPFMEMLRNQRGLSATAAV